MNHGVREALHNDVGKLSQVLAHAFERDPVHRWLLPSQAEWVRASGGFWAQLLRRALRHGVVLTPDGLEGTALWFPPAAPAGSFIEDLMFSARMLAVLRQRAWRGWRVGRLLETHRPVQPHWYLGVLGTAPEHQGKGISTAVMGPILRRCDAQRIPAYLESSNPDNVPLYERRGFRVTDEIVVPGGPTMWAMLRPPRQRAHPGYGVS